MGEEVEEGVARSERAFGRSMDDAEMLHCICIPRAPLATSPARLGRIFSSRRAHPPSCPARDMREP